jgi:hypothetical protein
MTNEELINRTMDLILSGGRRTTAANVRTLLNDIFPSYFNLEDGGNVVKVLSGYETELTPTDPKHFATKKYVDDNSGQTNWGDIQGYIEMQEDLVNYIAAEIAAIPAPDLTALWNLSGNTFDARKKLGSTSGDFGFDFVKNNTVQGGLSDTAKWYWGTNAAFTDTDHSFRGAGNTSASYVWQAQNSDNSQRAWLRGDGLFNATGGLSTDGVRSILVDTVNRLIKIGLNAGNSSTATYSNFFGELTGQNSSGGYNNIFGADAGSSQSGFHANLFGYQCGFNQIGNGVNGFGWGSLISNTAGAVTAMGLDSARENTTPNIFTVSALSNIFWNNVGDKGYTTLQTVTMQSAMSEDGTNTSAAASVMRFAAARATGNALGGDLQWMYSIPGSSGTTRQSLGLSATMKGSTGVWEFEKDLKFNEDTAGVILKDRTTATNYRLYVDSGALLIEAV